MQFLLNLPPPISFLLVSAVTTSIALVGLHFVRKKYSTEVLKENHEVAAIIFNAFGLFYGVIMAFVVFVTWSGYADALKRLNNLAQHRRLRIFAGNNTVPPVIWLVLLVGGVITVSYTYFFGMKNIKAQYTLTATLTVTITLILFLIYVLDHPFTGTSKVSAEPLKQGMEILQKE